MCSYRCNNKSILRVHEKVHNNTYINQCPHCSYHTFHPHQLKGHIAIKHGRNADIKNSKIVKLDKQQQSAKQKLGLQEKPFDREVKISLPMLQIDDLVITPFQGASQNAQAKKESETTATTATPSTSDDKIKTKNDNKDDSESQAMESEAVEHQEMNEEKAKGQSEMPFNQTYKESINLTLKCNYCKYVAPNKAYLLDHYNKHTGCKPFSCPYCSYRSNFKSNLVTHIKKYH